MDKPVDFLRDCFEVLDVPFVCGVPVKRQNLRSYAPRAVESAGQAAHLLQRPIALHLEPDDLNPEPHALTPGLLVQYIVEEIIRQVERTDLRQ